MKEGQDTNNAVATDTASQKTDNAALTVESIKEAGRAEFELSDGTKVVMTKPDAKQILQARRIAPDDEAVQIFLAADTSTFNGVKQAAPELIDSLSGDDFLLIEAYSRILCAAKKSSLPKTS